MKKTMYYYGAYEYSEVDDGLEVAHAYDDSDCQGWNGYDPEYPVVVTSSKPPEMSEQDWLDLFTREEEFADF